MEINEEHLRERYEALDTDELIELYRNSDLTELAQSVLNRILSTRGVDFNAFQEQVAKQEKENNLQGLRGWLILVGIGIVVSPLRMGALLLGTFVPIFTDGSWEVLTTPGSEGYSPFWAPYLFIEIIINTGLIVASIYMAYLFFSKKKTFPKWYIGVVVFSLIFIVIDACAIKLVMPNEPMFDPDTIREFARPLVACVIWVPYMLVSKRVKATFIK